MVQVADTLKLVTTEKDLCSHFDYKNNIKSSK
jgi:hypothetical protein